MSYAEPALADDDERRGPLLEYWTSRTGGNPVGTLFQPSAKLMRSRNRAIIVVAGSIGMVVAIHVVLSPPPVNPAEHAERRIEAHLKIPPQVRLTLREACYDCHSHETEWPWYSRLPFISQIITNDVRSGRADLNFSRWSTDPIAEPTPRQRLGGICNDVKKRIMPPRTYLLLHPTSRLTENDIKQICEWANSTIPTID